MLYVHETSTLLYYYYYSLGHAYQGAIPGLQVAGPFPE